MRFKQILSERLTEWDWLPQAVSQAVDKAINYVSYGSPPADPHKSIIGYAMKYLEQDPQIKSWAATLEKPVHFGIINAPDPSTMGAAMKIDSGKFLDVVKSFWNRQTQSWQLGVTVNLHLSDLGQQLPHWDQLKNAIESTIGHEMSHVSQFNSQLKKGFVAPGTLKTMGYEFADVLRNIAGQPSQPTRFERGSSYLKPETEIRRPIAKSVFDRITPEDKWLLSYRMDKLEFDAFAYSLGSTLRQQYGDQANAALNELANKIKMAGGGASELTILGQPLNKKSTRVAVLQFNLLYDANDLGLLKGDPQQLWQKFMKETSRYTIAQAADKLAAKAALKRVATMSEQQLAATIAKRLPELALKGALKSIPYAGAVIGVAFAINSLIQRDVLGAGLELTAGLGSVATAIPATAYQAAREVYSDYYTEEGGRKVTVEADAVQDPEGTKQRVDFLYNKIYTELKAKFDTGSIRLTGAQGAANARNALRNMDTPGNPSPALHPELYPQQESLSRILELAKS